MTIKISKKPVAPKYSDCYMIESDYTWNSQEVNEWVCRNETSVRDIVKFLDKLNGAGRIRYKIFYYDKNGAKFKATLS